MTDKELGSSQNIRPFVLKGDRESPIVSQQMLNTEINLILPEGLIETKLPEGCQEQARTQTSQRRFEDWVMDDPSDTLNNFCMHPQKKFVNFAHTLLKVLQISH